MEMNSKQKSALEQFIARMVAERSLAEGAYIAEMQADGKLHVQVDLPDFPEVTIGKQGGYDMPAIRSFPQEKGGATALDACVKGDEHLKRQTSGRRTAAARPTPVRTEAAEAPAEPTAEAPAPEPPPADPNVGETTVTLPE